MTDVFDTDRLADLEQQIDAWLAALAAEHDHIAAIDRATEGEIRWYVRLRGESKDYTTIWITLGQRTLRYETYVMPAPEENHREFFEHVLRRNDRLIGAHFSIGQEDALFLRGELPLAAVSYDEVDRLLGTVYAIVEQCFGGLLRIAFARRFAD